MTDSNVTPNFLVQITNVTTNALAKNCQSGGDTTPGQELMRRLHRDAGGAGTGARGAKRGQGQAPPAYAQELARLCDLGHPLAQWAARYMVIKVCGRRPNTVAAKARDLATFIKWFVDTHSHGDISRWIESDTRYYLDHLSRQGKKPTSINRALYTIAHFARWVHAQAGAVFARCGLPVQDVEARHVEEAACKKLRAGELRAVFAAARAAIDAAPSSGPKSRQRPRRNLALLAVLYYTGVRISEALSLQRYQYDGTCFFDVQCKGRRTRKVALHPECARLIDDYIERERVWDADANADTRGDGCDDDHSTLAVEPLSDAARPLFMARGSAPMDRRAASRMLEKLGLAAGQGDADESPSDGAIALHPHRLRHTFGARYREASGSDTETAAALGHAGLGYVGRYVRQSENERMAVLNQALSLDDSAL